MLYAALTFWLLVIVFSAWGVHSLWSGLIKPRAVNTILLPGTLVAQLGHVLGLLVTGHSVQNASLMGDDEKGEPTADQPERPRVPIIGPILVGLLPLAACTVCLYWAAHLWGGAVIGALSSEGDVRLPQALPATIPAAWQLLRVSINNSENMLGAILQTDLTHWPTLLFLYLAMCLTVRMTPFEGNRRGAIGAILLAGVTIGVLAALMPGVDGFVRGAWPVLSFATGMLLFLLLVSLAVSGAVGLVRILARNE
jgi:hypothetical protein